MSALMGKADIASAFAECLLLTQSEHSAHWPALLSAAAARLCRVGTDLLLDARECCRGFVETEPSLKHLSANTIEKFLAITAPSWRMSISMIRAQRPSCLRATISLSSRSCLLDEVRIASADGAARSSQRIGGV